MSENGEVNVGRSEFKQGDRIKDNAGTTQTY